jgi:hypothetical protein
MQRRIEIETTVAMRDCRAAPERTERMVMAIVVIVVIAKMASVVIAKMASVAMVSRR